MTDVADPYRRNDDDVTELDQTDRDGTGLDDGAPEHEDADIYTQTVKAPGLESGERTGLGDESTQDTAPVPETAVDNQLEHGLGTAGGSAYDATLEEGTEFGLGSENTQDTPPVPEPVEPDPLRHGLGQADEDNVH